MEGLPEFLRGQFHAPGIQPQENKVKEVLVWPTPHYHRSDGFVEKGIQIIKAIVTFLHFLQSEQAKVLTHLQPG